MLTHGIGKVIRLILQVLTAPIRGYLSLRRSLTFASIAILLSGFLTLNVIWGFPWSGMLGGCVAMLLVGFTINRVMRPRLKLSVALPRAAVAGQPFSINVRLTNTRYIPALNLRVGWHREGVRDIYPRQKTREWDASPPVNVDMLRSSDQMQWHGAMRFDRRGIHQLPPFQIASTFPFHFFHHRTAVETETKIAVTPAPIGNDDDATTRVMLAAIGDWAKQLVAGAPVEYIGNREYQEGVAVRRWDFASWARLGRPIVREYQSPSIQAVTLIVDTSQQPIDDKSLSRSVAKRRHQASDELFERLLSVAATAIADISSRRVQLKLLLTCEAESERTAFQSAPVGDNHERMLVRLAAATPIDPALGKQRILQTIESSRSQPTLIFSTIDLDDHDRADVAKRFSSHITYLPVKPAQKVDPDEPVRGAK